MTAAEGLPVQLATRVLGVSESGYYEWRGRAPSLRAIRHAWLTEQIQAVHAASRGTYGALRVHAELTLGMGITVGHGAVAMLMNRAGIKGLPGNRRPRPRHQTPTASDLVHGQFVMDTVNQGGGASGSLDSVQLSWLGQQLTAGSSSYLDASGQVVRQRVRDRLFILFSHHTIATMDNPSLAPGETGPRVLGPQVQALLLQFPNVIAWVNGHTHINQVTGFARPSGSSFDGGFWEINTASHIDWPQQSRLVEVTDNRDGTLSVIATITDTAAPPSYCSNLADPLDLASLSRELGINDWQAPAPAGGTDGRRGTVPDRNVELIVPAPSWIAAL